jgi:hypothetical protein
MADISRLSRLVAGVQRHVDLSANTLVLDNIKLYLGADQSPGAEYVTFAGTLTDVRTITVPNGDVDLGDIALNTADRHVAATLSTDDPTQQTLNLSGQEIQVNLATASTDGAMSAEDKSKLDGIEAGATADQSAAEVPFTPEGDIAASNVQAAIQEVRDDTDTKLSAKLDLAGGTMSGAIAMGSQLITGLASGTATDHAVNKGQLDAVEALVNGLEWQVSAKDYIVDNTATPPTETSGDRYVLSHDGGTPNAAWDGALAGNIVEFDGASWVALAPTTGTFISVDDETTLLYYWGGSSWTTKSFEATTASVGLTKSGFDIQLADAALASGIQVSSGAISIGLATDPGLEFLSGALRAKIKATSGLVRDADGLSVNLGDFSTTDLSEGSNLYFTDARAIAAPITGFTSGAGALAGTDTVLEAIQKLDGNIGALTAADVAYVNSTSGLTATDVQAAIDEVEGRVDTLEAADSTPSTVDEDLDAGEALGTGLKALRWAKAADAGFVAGRVYLADKDASTSDDFFVAGLVVAASETAGTTVTVTKAGLITATAHGFTVVGAPLYLDASGAVTATAPSAADEAVVRVGMVRDANTIEVQVQVMGVN